jgi:hypothetical protein
MHVSTGVITVPLCIPEHPVSIELHMLALRSGDIDKYRRQSVHVKHRMVFRIRQDLWSEAQYEQKTQRR